jgi:hypothetical protein
MAFGSIALLDALGWKGIWKRHGKFSEVIGALRKVREAVLKDVEHLLQSLSQVEQLKGNPVPKAQVRALFLSDTIAIAASIPEEQVSEDAHRHELQATFLQMTVADLAARAFRAAVLGEPPIALRGAIATGRFHIEENFLIGPAVDRAANLMDLPDGAFVWVDPASPAHIITEVCGRYDIPLKGVGPLDAAVVDPVFGIDEKTGEKIHLRALQAFGAKADDVTVLMKRQHTDEFLLDMRKGSAGVP